LIRPTKMGTKLRVGMFATTFPPWTKRDEQSGLYTGGFHFEYYRELGRVGGYQIEFVPFPPEFINDFGGVAAKMLDDGKIDMGWDTPFMLRSGYLYSPPMLKLTHNIITRRIARPVAAFQHFRRCCRNVFATTHSIVEQQPCSFRGQASWIHISHICSSPRR